MAAASLRLAVLAVVVLLLGAPFAASGAAGPGGLPLVVPGLDPVVRTDPDGGRTVVAVLEDGVGGQYRHVPISDEGLAAFTDVAASNGVAIDPIVYGASLRAMGAFAHSFDLDGVPYLTLGTYLETAEAGLVRFPVVMIENVADLEGAALFLASIVGDDAIPLVAEAIPHAYALAAPDAGPVVLIGAVAVLLVAAAPLLAAGMLQGADAGTGALNLPPEAYAALQKVGVDVLLLFFPLLFGPAGLPAPAGAPAPYGEDWVDRPEVRVWTVRKTAPGAEVWKGAYVERTGHSNGGPSHAFEGTKRIETGLALRIGADTTHVAGVYVQTDASRAAGSGALASRVRYTVGATAADTADAPLAAVEMQQARNDGFGRLEYLPESQQEDWRLGVYAGSEFVPLVGLRTTMRHDVHPDVTNLGQPITEAETERITSLGAYAGGEYVPLVGARYWGERSPAELYALLFVGGGLLGDQIGGDVEVSAGTFVQGSYVPVVGARIDDDFPLHHHAYRTLVSAGIYPLGAFMPLAGATYDGERPFLVWAQGHAAGGADGDTRWQTSAGAFALGYRPALGGRYEPRTHGQERAQQESYQLGVYAASYPAFVPLLAAEYDGDRASALFPQALVGGASGAGREGAFDADLVAFAPVAGAVPIAGAQYRTAAPDLDGAYGTHVALGVYVLGAFTPLAGASVAADDHPVGVVLAGGAAGARVSAGPYVGGAYAPLVRMDVPPP